MTYKDQIVKAMTELGAIEEVVFIGQGISIGDRVYGTMNGVPTNKCLELPTTENLAVGVALGLALKGFRPVLVFQRMDFMLQCADALINHMALIPEMSGGQVKFPIIIRAIVGSQDRKKFDVGLQHNKDLAYIFQPWIPTTEFRRGMEIYNTYMSEYKDPSEKGAIMIEYKDMYDQEVKVEGK